MLHRAGAKGEPSRRQVCTSIYGLAAVTSGKAAQLVRVSNAATLRIRPQPGIVPGE